MTTDATTVPATTPPTRSGPTIRQLAWIIPAAAVLIAAPLVLDEFQTLTLLYGLIAAIGALGFNLLLGYTGLLSFGHSAFFGGGAYTVAFMVKYLKLASMELFLAGSALTSVFLSIVFGFVCVRYTRIFFGILTLALSQVLWSLAFKFYNITGGSDGLRVPTPSILGSGVPADKMAFLSHQYYYYVLGLFAVAVVVMWVIVHSPFGKALQAIRDNEVRAEFIGIRIRRYRLIAFVISGVFTGVAGALWAPLNGLASPDVLVWTFSGEIVFMTVLGGFRTFVGPIVGAIAFTYLKTYAVGFTVYWQLLLGTVLVVLVLALPTGIMGALLALVGRWKRAK
jgi:branched-chain amino acid transport system permease protein